MRKIVINSCYGGFSLSPKGLKRLAELQGKECYFFKDEFVDGDIKYIPVSIDEIGDTLFFSAFTVSNPQEVLLELNQKNKSWREMTNEEKESYNKAYDDIYLSAREIPRDDLLLVQVVEELGKAASGRAADLKIVEIPEDVEWQIEEYDGLEYVAEKHKTWS